LDKTILRSTKLVVRDLQRAAKFFHAVAGFEEITRFQSKTGAWEIIFEQREGEASFILMEYAKIPASPQSNVVLVFSTADAAAFGKRVLQAGGQVLHEAHPVSTGSYNMIILMAADPEGNVLEAVEMR
jgi:predicted enzyme related to lactoylglutathione lyase